MTRRLNPAIHRVPYDKLTLYEITESELEALERGSPDSLLLNFAIFAFSAAISFSTTLSSTDIKSDRTFSVFVIVTVVGYLAASILFSLWWFSRRSVGAVASAIRNRATPEGIQENRSEDPL